MRVGVDLDDVLGEFMPQILSFHNERYGSNYTIRDAGHFHALFDLIGKSDEEAIGKMEAFYKSRQFKEMKPVKGAKANLKKIKDDGHQLIVITGRPSHIREKTTKWLDEHFADLFDEVHFADHCVHPHGWTKGEMCKKLEIHHHIDDFLTFAKDCAKNGINVLLLDRPWNQDVELENNIKRVFTWDEISLDLVRAKL